MTQPMVESQESTDSSCKFASNSAMIERCKEVARYESN